MPAHLSDAAIDEGSKHPSTCAGLGRQERLFPPAKSALSSPVDIPACQLSMGVSALLAGGVKRIADGVALHRPHVPDG